MYTRILVPLDGSKLAEQVLPYVRSISSAMKCPIELLSVFRPASAELSNPYQGLYLHQIDVSFHDQSKDYLDSVKASMYDMHVPIICNVQQGAAPASWIVSEAEKEEGTLIAMSTHGRSGISRWVLGSVTDKVLHATNMPLLVVRSTEDEEEDAIRDVDLDCIIVPLDGSSLGEQSLPFASDLSKSLDLTVNLIRVEPRETKKARDYLAKVKERLQEDGVSAVSDLIINSHPAAAIVDLARDTPSNLVAITTHGRSGLGRWVLGSVADRVVRHSGDPVLVVRAAD